MGVALANSNPYIHASDDVLAQLCQGALTFTMTVGLLQKAATSFQDKYFGPVLIFATTVQFLLGACVAFVQWMLGALPNTIRKWEGMAGLLCPDSGVQHGILIPQRLDGSFVRRQTVSSSVAPAPIIPSEPGTKTGSRAAQNQHV